MINIQFKMYYLGFLISKYHTFERNTNIFLALTSTGSIAAWAIWDRYPLLWGLIIAASHIVASIKPYFPFTKYAKVVNDKHSLCQSLSIDFERLWYRIQNDKVAEDEVEEEYFALRKRVNLIDELKDDMALMNDRRIIDKANKKVEVYLKSNFNIKPNYS